MKLHDTIVPMSVIDATCDKADEVEVRFEWTPGQAPSGLGGPPEDYDPGSGDEFEIRQAYYLCGDKGDVLIPCGLAGHEEEAVVEWLSENWEPPEPDYPEPDFQDD